MRFLVLVLFLSGCGGATGTALKAVSAISGNGGGPSVGVDVQAGGTRETSGVRQSDDTTQRISGRNNQVTQTTEKNEVRTIERVETINNNERTPPWIWLLMLLGWLLPTPQNIGQFIWRTIMRRRAP